MNPHRQYYLSQLNSSYAGKTKGMRENDVMLFKKKVLKADR